MGDVVEFVLTKSYGIIYGTSNSNYTVTSNAVNKTSLNGYSYESCEAYIIDENYNNLGYLDTSLWNVAQKTSENLCWFEISNI